MQLFCLPPVHTPATEILILGSFPGQASLDAQQYYAHPRNLFWPLVGHALDVDLAARTYAERLQILRARHIGIWDVIGVCQRSGSLDSAIRDPQWNDFAALFKASPNIRRVLLNGGMAARQQRVIAQWGKEVLVLPSSSPANAGQSLAFKRQVWSAALTLTGEQ